MNPNDAEFIERIKKLTEERDPRVVLHRSCARRLLALVFELDEKLKKLEANKINKP